MKVADDTGDMSVADVIAGLQFVVSNQGLTPSSGIVLATGELDLTRFRLRDFRWSTSYTK